MPPTLAVARGRRLRWLLLISLVFAVNTAVAEAPETSLRPTARATPETTEADPERKGLFKSLRPLVRSREAKRRAREQKRLLEKGAVCGDLAIQGVVMGRVPGRIRGCGIERAVRVRSVSGVELSQKSVMDCATARALKVWIDTGVKRAVGNKGGGVARLRVAAHYACRTRNNRKGAKISEHGKGRAIDISAVQLRDGSEFSVLRHWGKGSYGKILRQMHRSACGPFGTVLGPGADRYHRDHFHFDTARYRSGSYCR